MRRIGVVSFLIVLLLAAFFGCKETGTEAKQTGIELQFSNCITFEAWVSIDGEYQGSYTNERPSIIEMSAGGHELYIQSNVFTDVTSDTFFCWTEAISVTQDEVTPVTLACPGHKCVTAAP